MMGNRNAVRKLDDDDISLILQLRDDRKRLKRELSGVTQKAIAEKFGVHYRTIERIERDYAV